MMAGLLGNLNVALLVFVRVMAMAMVAPLLSSSSLPGIARAGLALFITAAVYPQVAKAGYPLPDRDAQYLLLLLGEAMVGIIVGLYLLIIFAAFQVAGEFFSVQMGFGASEVFDPLAQIEIPLMGQFLYLVSMLVFLQVDGFQQLLIAGVMRSFDAIRAADLVGGREALFQYILTALGRLFESALTISFPVLGTLLLVSISLGLLAKAAPQMNLLMVGFPISLAVAFVLLLLVMPYLMSTFGEILNAGFEGLAGLFAKMASATGGAP
jgi:flagellar biosynthetic protein FliR